MAGIAILTAREVRARRLARHGLTAPLPDQTPSGAVAAMHGAQAQIASAAELSVALRVPGATRATVRAALADGSVTRTFGPRGTIHLLPTCDLATWLGALGAVPSRSPFADDVRLSPSRPTPSSSPPATRSWSGVSSPSRSSTRRSPPAPGRGPETW